MARLPTGPVSGMRDHLPRAALLRRETIRRIEASFSRHGFWPLETPAMERLSTLLGKYGEEGDRLIYRVLHRGDRLAGALTKERVAPSDLSDLGLRYDLTVPLARVVAEYRSDLPPVFRRYQIQPVWRADRAQRGRFREFTQCDADIVGSRSILADAECLLVLVDALASLGFRGFTVALNHRALLSGLIAAAGIEPEVEGAALVAVDKLDKIGPEAVEAALARLEGVGPERARRLLGLLFESGGEEGDPTRIRRLTAAIGGAGEARARAAGDDLLGLLDALAGGLAEDAGVVRFNPALARGLSYYTGPIFEVVMPGAAGSLAGGGRYDGLVGMFSGRDVPAVGFSLGMERILLTLEETEAGGARGEAGPVAMLCPLPGLGADETLRAATALRRAGVRLTVAVDRQKLGKALARASREGVRFALILGPDELAAGSCAVRDLETGEQAPAPFAEVPARIARAAAPDGPPRSRRVRGKG